MAILNNAQRTHLKNMLLARQELLRGEIRAALQASRDERHRELAGAVHDAGDESLADLLVDVNLKGMDRDAQEFSAIGSAFDRMSRKEYGVCLDCRTDIGYARLEAQPTAERCIECETRHDRRYAHERNAKL